MTIPTAHIDIIADHVNLFHEVRLSRAMFAELCRMAKERNSLAIFAETMAHADPAKHDFRTMARNMLASIERERVVTVKAKRPAMVLAVVGEGVGP